MNDVIVVDNGRVLLNAEKLSSYLETLKSNAYWWDGKRTLDEISKFIQECKNKKETVIA